MTALATSRTIPHEDPADGAYVLEVYPSEDGSGFTVDQIDINVEGKRWNSTPTFWFRTEGEAIACVKGA